jgi:hypothetical protein
MKKSLKLLEFGLDKLKKDYKKYQTKYSLPNFEDLNKFFEIERVADHDTDFLLREIRKAITEKALAFVRFIELLINPTAAPFFMFTIIKNIQPSDKKLIEKIYEKLCGFEISAIKLDMCYNEKDESEFIKKSLKLWKENEDDLRELSKIIERAWKTSSNKKEKDYFG